jgi:hypothetical protein
VQSVDVEVTKVASELPEGLDQPPERSGLERRLEGHQVTERRVVLTIPDMGLSRDEIETLRSRFENQFIESLGGRAAMARRAVVVVVVVVVVY